MLDDTSLRLAPSIVDKLFEMLGKLVESKGLSVLLGEHNVGNALRLAKRGYVIEQGHLLKSGRGQDVLNDPDVQRSYLGL